MWSLMAACDVLVNLRYPTMGETSGSVIRALSLGRPLVVSDVGWFSELPDDVVLKVPVDEYEVATLEAAIGLAADRRRGARRKRARVRRARARAGLVADRYVRRSKRQRGPTRSTTRCCCGSQRRRWRWVSTTRARSRVPPSTPGSSREARGSRAGSRARCDRRPSRPPCASCSRGRMPAPWIMVDELIYSELGKSVAADGHFLVRGVPSSGYGFVYPVLLAPASGSTRRFPSAYAAAKVINACVMSLAAIPTYFLARRLLTPWLSVGAAALSVAIPSMLYTGTLMTENAFYPVFVLAALLLVLTLERPTALRQVLLLAVCGLAFATRAQAIALVGAALLAPVVHGLIDRDVGRVPRRFATLYGLTAAGRGARARRDRRARAVAASLLGAYRAATDRGYSLTEIGRYVLWHVAELDLSLGVVGFAALIAMWLAPRSTSAGARAFSAATLSITVLLVVEVGAFASMQSFRIEERNDFYVAPFALIALFGLAARNDVVTGARRVRAAAVLVAGSCPWRVPFARFVNSSAVSDTFGLLPWWWLQDQGIHFHSLRFVALGVGVAAAALVFVPRRFALVPVGARRGVLRARVGDRRERAPRRPPGLRGRPVRRDPPASSRLDRPAGGARRRRRRSSGTTPARRVRSGTTSSSIAA